MELELKHLAPYFLYELKGTKLYDDKFYYVTSIDKSKLRLHNEESDESILIDIAEFKPMFKSLNDIDKDIYFNREMFIPLDWFDKNISPLNCSHKEMKEIFVKDVLKMPYPILQKLFEWGFDVFGLIEQDLAYNNNPLNK